jgi:hypothetical protein
LKQAAIGFRVHSGWAAAVVVSLHKGVPCVLTRNRAHLVETFNYTFRQPFHTARDLPLNEAREFVARVEADAEKLAREAIRRLQSELGAIGIKLSNCALLLASGRSLPELEKILASHSLVHTADGVLFREAILRASSRCGLKTFSIKERELFDHAKKALRVQPAALLRRLTALGKPLGSPWSQDEKFAALAAWLALRTPANQRRAKPATRASLNFT